MILPAISSVEEYRVAYADTATWIPAMRVLCARHALEAGKLQRTTLGTHLVFRTGGCAIKLFSTFWRDDFTKERAALMRIRGLPVPELIAEGELEGWPYLVIGWVDGVPAGEVWASLGDGDRYRVVRQPGELMAALHAQPAPPELAIDWNAFIAARIDRALAHHGATDPWTRWIETRLANFNDSPFTPVMLNADINGDHLQLSQEGGEWRITGLIDFGDAMAGHPFYEFVAPLCFYTFGRPKLSRALIDAYGLERTPEVMEQLTTYCLLHEFGRLEDFLMRHPAADGREFIHGLWGAAYG